MGRYVDAARSASERVCQLAHSFERRHHFEQVPVEVREVEAPAATAGVDLPIFVAARPAAPLPTGCLDPFQDGVELGVGDVEGVMMTLERVAVVEVEGQRVVDLDGREVSVRTV